MLPPPYRLRKTKEIERVFREGRGLKEGSFLLKAARNGLKISRFGFIVSQKSVKKAVQRNKIKRRLREIVKNNLSCLKPGFDVIIITLKDIEDKKFEELRDSAQKLFEKAGLM